MKRLAFLASLFSFGAAAQKLKLADPPPKLNEITLGWKVGKFVNGQCPVCGTMSAPVAPTEAPRMVFAKDGDSPTKFYWSKAEPVRCLRCNACFWRDSE